MRIDLLDKPTHALVAANVVVALMVCLTLAFPATPSAPVAESPTADATLPEFGSAATNHPELADLVDMMERPLFYDDRRMPEPPEEVAPEPPPQPLRLALLGVAVAGDAGGAVLRHTGNNQVLNLAVGQVHEGWTLASVDAASAHFTRGSQTQQLRLETEDRSR